MNAPVRVVRAGQHGIKMPIRAYRAARKVGVPYWVACAFLMQETSGGMNVFGHDPGNYSGAGVVTKRKYLDYKRRRQAGYGMQGVGPMQLTWYTFQDRADELGGCWRPSINIRVGLEIVKQHYQASGSWVEAARRYNGSGAAANVYAASMAARFAYWRDVLAGD
jgi:hypothetical protein